MFFYVCFEKSICLRFPFQLKLHYIERFEVQNSKNILEKGSPSPLSRPLPRSSLGFALDSGLNPSRTPQHLKRGCALGVRMYNTNVHNVFETSRLQEISSNKELTVCI